jgi:glycerol uptake facilitator-like aquaporin
MEAGEGDLGYAVETGTTGIGTMVVIYSLRYVSGAHTNPCTTIAFALYSGTRGKS